MAPYSGYKRDGRTKEPEWQGWLCMMRRCYEKNWRDYKNYGARGISVYEPWHDYRTYLKDVGRRPPWAHSLDRIDNDGNYEPGNVRWATRQQQMANRRGCVKLTHYGRTMCVAEWARATGLQANTITARLNRGWPIEQALKAVKN